MHQRRGAEWRGAALDSPWVLACVFQNLLVGMEEEDWFIGDEAQKRRRELNLQCPVSRATVTNWDNMEKVGSASVAGDALPDVGGVPAAPEPGEAGVPASGALRPRRHYITLLMTRVVESDP